MLGLTGIGARVLGTWLPLLPLLLVITLWSPVNAQETPNTDKAKDAFFNASVGAYARLPGTVNLTGQTLFSFRTCSHGPLLSQTGSSGDSLSLIVTQDGRLSMVWRAASGVADSVSVSGGSEGFSNNQWYTVDLKYLLGDIHLQVESGSRLLDRILVSNSTYRRYLWDLDLSGGPQGITVGDGFTGCILQGAGIQFDTNGIKGHNVAWGQCPLESPTARGCDLQQYNPCYLYPCRNGGTCKPNGTNYTCTCPVPFSGKNCERDLGDQACSLEPCKNGGTCSILTGQTRRFICNCPSGFAGVQCENNIDECGSVPCMNGGKCHDMVDGFRCDCNGTGYKGTVCQTNIDECESGRPCQNSGTCINTPGSYKCACLNGYDGQNCETDLDECVSQPCQNGGACTDYLGMYKCDCRVGFTGANCESNIDDCVNHNCVHPKQCVDGVNNHTCQCKPGFVEDSSGQCEDVDECSSSPCVNGAPCSNEENRFVCACLPGYEGVTCEHEIDECASRPCQNGGSCSDGLDLFRCDCAPGFTGPTCSVDIDECAPDPCVNGATCHNLIAMYSCACVPGFSGPRCEVDVDECTSGPCQNGAPCEDGVNGYTCMCPNGFNGPQCEINIDDCSPAPCFNGATCVDGVATYDCNCTMAWMGHNCTEQYDACHYEPCFNGATCSSVLGTQSYTCTCVPGFTGTDCKTNIDDCINNTCMPYQECIDQVQGHRCACPTGYQGAECEENIDECASDPCLNGATCQDGIGNYTCVCAGQWIDLRNFSGNAKHLLWSGYKGEQCEILVNECEYDPPVCLNKGICQKQANQPGFDCYCGNNAGNFYLGKHCEKTRQHCELEEDPPPCHNGGTCFNLRDHYSCQCAPGFSDTTTPNRCRVNIDECASDPCQNNGTCEDGINGYVCHCPPGLSGSHCEVNIDECQSTPCLNGGRCLDAVNKYVCDCGDTGFEGANCELNIDDCNPTPCLNGATCMDGIKNYTCACYAGYAGVNCQLDVDECQSQPCQNGATCGQRSDPTRPDFSHQTAAGYDCQCAPGYNGTHCEHDIDECASDPCKNGACQDRINSYFCLCDKGYEGVNCDIDIDECALLKPCKNGGNCIDKVAGYECVCAAEVNGTSYGGENCTVRHTGCQVNVCQNDARCVPYLVSEADGVHNYTCHCQPGFTGFYCELDTTVSFNGKAWLKQNISMTLDTLEVSLEFRTTLPNGTLFHMSDATGTKRVFLVLAGPQLLTLFVKIDETQTVSLSQYSTRNLNDVNWHRVQVHAAKSQLIISLSSPDCSPPNCESTQSIEMVENAMFTSVLFGGLERVDQEPTLTAQTRPLTGCLQDIRVKSKFVLPAQYVADPQMSDGVVLGCPRTDPCLPQPCQHQGTCVDLWDRFSCHCERPYAGATCNISLTPATFGYQNEVSHVDFQIPANEQVQLLSKNHLSLFFRTREEQGLLAFLGPQYRVDSDPISYLQAYLEDGYVVVSSKLSPIQADKNKLIMNYQKYNDGQQHFLFINRTGEHLSVKVDDQQKAMPVTVHQGLTGQALYLGALPSGGTAGRRRRRAATTMERPGPYKGTLQDVRLNGQLAELFPVNGTGLPTLSPAVLSDVREGEVDDDLCAGASLCENNGTCESVFFNEYKCHCPDGFKGKNCSALNFCIYNQCPGNSTCNDLADGHECTIAATFDGESSMLQYGTQFFAGSLTANTLKLSLRTRDKNSMLLHVHGAASLSTYYLTLQLIESSLMLRYDLGEYGLVSLDDSGVDDGQWHNISVVIRDYEVVMSVDSKVVTHQTAQSMQLVKVLNDTTGIYLGGIPSAYYRAHSSQFGKVTPTFLKGCLEEVRIDGVLLPFFGLGDGYNSSAAEQFSVVSKTGLQTGCRGDPVCRESLCMNDATCMDEWNAYTCSCVLGFNGTYCGNNIDDCVNNDCLNGAQCLDHIANYTCACAPGYTDSRCETDYDECTSDPCQNNATCEDRVDGYLCNCSANYTGIHCEVSVTEKCNNETDYPCVHGICNTIETAYEGVVTFECLCPAGYTGRLCESEIDYCAVDPCVNGTCRSNINITDYECLCQPGFEGKNCSQEIDECESQPCQNGGTCTDFLNNYNCSCPPEWTGPNCEADVNECNFTTSPCVEGRCINTDGGYICDCTGTGYHGDRCQNETDECLENEEICQNDATCHNVDRSYYCNCTVGYEDKNCSTPNCTDVCTHSGNCSITAENTWMCTCPKFHEGAQCELRGPCADAPCVNGGNCSQATAGTDPWTYTCACPTGWTGKNCSEDVKECDNPICENGGTCNELNGTFRCDCAVGFTGKYCRTNIDECESEPCQNGGQCQNNIGSYSCNCTGTGFEGTNCEKDIEECKTKPCMNGTCYELEGSFECRCYERYLGPLCNYNDPCRQDVSPCENGANCTAAYNHTIRDTTFACHCTADFTGTVCDVKVGGVGSNDSNALSLIIGFSVFALLIVILLIAVVSFMLVAKNKRATRGTYSPSRQEMSGSRVEMGNVLKPPPEERLI